MEWQCFKQERVGYVLRGAHLQEAIWRGGGDAVAERAVAGEPGQAVIGRRATSQLEVLDRA